MNCFSVTRLRLFESTTTALVCNHGAFPSVRLETLPTPNGDGGKTREYLSWFSLPPLKGDMRQGCYRHQRGYTIPVYSAMEALRGSIGLVQQIRCGV